MTLPPVFGIEFVIVFAITCIIGGFLSSENVGNKVINAVVGYLGQLAIAPVIAGFWYFVVNLVAAIGNFGWNDLLDWEIGRWLAIVSITIFYAKNVWDGRQGNELKPGLVVGRCRSNARNWK